MERSNLAEFEIGSGAWGKTREASSFVADVTATYERTLDSTLSLDFVDPSYQNEETAITDNSALHSTYGEEFTAYYESQSETPFTGGVAGVATGSAAWGKSASGTGQTDIAINSSFDYGAGQTESFEYTGNITSSTAFEENWTQPTGGALTGGVTLDTSQYAWTDNSQTTSTSSQGSTVVVEPGSFTSPAGLGNTLYELEGEIGWNPQDLASLADDLPYASLSGFTSGSWSAGPSGTEGTIAYTPPPGSQPEAPQEETSPVPEPVPYGWDGYWNGVGQVFKGYGNAAVGTVQGLVQVGLHPLQTSIGLFNAALHPIDTATAIFDDYANKLDTLEGQGEIVGEFLIDIASSGTVAAAAKGAKAGKLGRTMQKVAKAVDNTSAPLVSTTVRSGIDDTIRPATRVRAISKGEKVDDLIREIAQATYESGGLEHAIVSLHDGTRIIVRGGPGGIQFGDDIRRIILHTHPSTTGPSAADFAMLRALGQTHSYIYELFGGGLTRFE